MEGVLQEFDALAGIETEEKFARWLERLAFFFLILMALTAPHSIAASQTSWLLGMVFWIARFFFKPRPRFIKTALLIPFGVFFLWSVFTSLTSYAPDISLDKLRNVGLFVIFFFAVNNLRTRKAVKFIALALIFSCLINVLWTPLERIFGRGVEIRNVRAESPLKVAGLRDGDTIIKVNGEKVSSPEEILEKVGKSETAVIDFYRPDYYLSEKIKKEDLLGGSAALEKLGVGNWKKSRNWRSTGFYGHYATYAEVLQLIGSLVLGLFIIALSGKSSEFEDEGQETSGISRTSLMYFIITGLIALALLLTVTRASQAALMISASVMLLLGGSRKLILIAVLVAVPVIAGGLFFLQQSREVGFVDPQDTSITWRQTVYREGFELWIKNPRHFLLGVGMDSVKRYKDEWGMFDHGRIPSGHFHSTPLQLVVERGFPALLLWFWILGIFAFHLFRAVRRRKFSDRTEKGIVLGAVGGLTGFFASGIVHYNLGDGEVAMVFFLLMGLAIALLGSTERSSAANGIEPAHQSSS